MGIIPKRVGKQIVQRLGSKVVIVAGKMTGVGVAVDVIIDFFTNYDPIVSEGREQDAIKLHALQQEIQESELEISQEDPPQIIVRQIPKKIYDETNNPSGSAQVIKLPEIPETQYPQPDISTNSGSNSSNTSTEYSVTVGEALKDHTFGCLIPKTFTNEPLQILTPQIPTRRNLWGELVEISKADYEEYTDNKNNNDFERNSENEAFLTYYLPYSEAPIIIRGTRAIDELALNYQARSKMVENFPVASIPSSKIPVEVPYEVEIETQQLEYYFIEKQLTEAGIPLDLYSGHHLPLRKEDQLIIFWRNENWDEEPKRKQIAFPKPKKNRTFFHRFI